MRLYTLMISLGKGSVRFMLRVWSALAWKLGVKLPKSYDFFYLSSHGVGHNAMLGFLHHCGVKLNWHFEESGKQRYAHLYQMLLKAKYAKIGGGGGESYAIALSECGFTQKEEFFATFAKRAPAICLVRDPIGVIKSILNLSGRGGEGVFTLDTPYEQITQVGFGDFTQAPIFWGEASPHLASIATIVEDSSGHIFIQNSLQESLQKVILQTHYIDMQQITSQNAYATMLDLSQKFGFNPPEKDSVIWTTKMFGEINGVLPFSLHIPLSGEASGQVLEVSITLEQYAMWQRGITYLLQDFIKQTPFTNIAITIPSDKAGLLSQALLQRLESFMQGFIEALQRRVEYINAHKITEVQVLDFLREHKDVAKKLEAKLDRELARIVSNRADIVNGWGYYQQFKELCLV